MLSKISLYLKLGLLVFIIILSAFIAYQYIRIQALTSTIDDLKIKNEVLNKNKKFYEARIKILSDFSNSTTIIENITNEIIFPKRLCKN